MAEYIGYRSLKGELPGSQELLEPGQVEQVGGKLGKNREFYLKFVSCAPGARRDHGPWTI